MRLRNTIRSLWQGGWNTQRIRIRKVPALIVAVALLAGAGRVQAQYSFGEPENLGPVVNSPAWDTSPSISADGLSLYFWSSESRPGGFGGNDLWMMTRISTADPWQPPVNLGSVVNSSSHDLGPSISADGLALFFNSPRPGGSGEADLWMTTRASPADPWQPPVNLGPVVNSSYKEALPDISTDGLTLFFQSDRPGGFGSIDLWMTTRASPADPWQPPVNLGPTFNTSYIDGSPNISADGLTLFFASKRPGGLGEEDMWMSTRTSLSDPWQPPVHLGPTVNSSSVEWGASISADGLMLFFNSTRPGGSGNHDLWQVAVTPTCVELNGICEYGEDCWTCPPDCFSSSSLGCDNGACEPALGEDCLSCPGDCNGKQKGNPDNRFCCGDGDGESAVGCADPRCTSDGFDCSFNPVPSTCCGDGLCEGAEDSGNCELDCGLPTCGDAVCEGGEDQCTCESDCGTPPATETDCTDGIDEDCDGASDCDDGDCAGDPACIPDTVPPDAVTDLGVDTAATTSVSVTLTWTATGDDGSSGNASLYDIRYSTSPIVDDTDFENATQAENEYYPQPPGSPESFAVVGLESETTYDFALKVADEAGNFSGLSNVVSETTLVAPLETWSIQTVDSIGKVGMFSSVALDSLDNPHISYWDDSNDDAKYARWTGSAWAIETIPDPVDLVGRWTSLVLDDSSGDVHVIYFDDSNHDLRYALLSGSVWSTETVDASGPSNGNWNSLVLDGNGNLHISYRLGYDNTGGGLKYATGTSSQWASEVVLKQKGAGLVGTSLALDPAGKPSIAYNNIYNGIDSRLEYAQWTGSAWQIEIVDEEQGGRRGDHCSLAIDASGNRYISYWDWHNGLLRYARWDSAMETWEFEVLDVDAGQYTSLALDSGDKPHISYYDYTNLVLKYAHWNSTTQAWEIEVVDEASDVGQYTSLGLDSSDNPHISYYDVTRRDLRYAHKSP